MASLEKRGSVWFVQWYEGDRQGRRSLGTNSLQVAKEKLRRFESGLYRGEDCPLPMWTPIAQVVAGAVPGFPLSHWPTVPIRPILQA